MLSDTFPFDTCIAPPDPLDFDDLLDIARELEFARTTTHIWPCDQELDDPGLDDILSAITLPVPNAQDVLPSPVQARPAPDADAWNAMQATLPNDDDHTRIKPSIPALSGWSPPNGSDFLDLDDSLTRPQLPRDIGIPPWLSALFASSLAQPTCDAFQTVSAMEDMHQRVATTLPPVSAIPETTKRGNGPTTPLPPGPATCPDPELLRARAALHPTQAALAPKPSKPRPHVPSAVAAGTLHAKPPRGGIPPHIARSVTKANILRAEKEREIVRDTFTSTTTGQAKKPSVLRGAAKVDSVTSRTVYGVSTKKPFDRDENDSKGRAAKRTRV